MMSEPDSKPAHPVTHAVPDVVPVSRRQATAWLLVGAAGVAMAPRILRAQPATSPAKPAGTGAVPARPATPVPSFLDNCLTVARGKTKNRTLRANLMIRAYQEDYNRRTKNDKRPLSDTTLDFATAAIVFPVLYGTATSKTDIENVKGVVKYDNRIVDATPEYNDTYPCGTRLAKWTMLNQKGGKQVSIEVDIPMTCNETVFDERAAAQAVWPKKWGKIGQSTFTNQMFVDYKSAEVSQVVSGWTSGKDPKTIPPLQLAKYLASKCVETFQFSGSGEQYSKSYELEGLEVKKASRTVVEKRGTEHDIAAATCAIFLAAGLPARLVIGWDESDTKSGDRTAFERTRGTGEIRSWIEFCLYDEAADKELWVPFDPVRQRKKSSRPAPIEKAWEYFGNFSKGEFVMPFAFQFHPPTTVIEYGSLAFWGWLTTPKIPAATQYLRLSSESTPNRGGGRPTRGR